MILGVQAHNAATFLCRTVLILVSYLQVCCNTVVYTKILVYSINRYQGIVIKIIDNY